VVRAPQRGCAVLLRQKGRNDMNSTKSAARPWLLGCAVFSLALAPLGVSAQTSGPIKIGVIAEAQAVAVLRPGFETSGWAYSGGQL